ncbi:MAG: response regulator transcription factor, partial [Myxococcales bacterium]
LKDTPPAELITAVRSAAAGATALSPAVANRLFTRMSGSAITLTAREHETLSAVAQGMSNREAARSLYLSEATVKSHLVQVFHKLKVKSRTAAVARARELGLID